MKTLWNIISFMAVVHLLALLIFIGWLWQSQRLNRDRIQQVREMLAVTIPEAAAIVETEAQAQATVQAEQLEEANKHRWGFSSAEIINSYASIQAQELQAVRRVKSEVEALQFQLDQQTRAINARQSRLDARDEAWKEANAAEVARKSDEQFQKTVKLYESAKPKLAKARLLNLYEGGDLEQVVAYLNAMNPRASKKILDEFKSDQENAMAAKLLEALRTFGLPPENPEGSTYDTTVASAD